MFLIVTSDLNSSHLVYSVDADSHTVKAAIFNPFIIFVIFEEALSVSITSVYKNIIIILYL